MRTPFSIYDQAGKLVAEGSLGGDPLMLDAGFYKIKVSGSSPKGFEKVEVVGEKEVILEY